MGGSTEATRYLSLDSDSSSKYFILAGYTKDTSLKSISDTNTTVFERPLFAIYSFDGVLQYAYYYDFNYDMIMAIAKNYPIGSTNLTIFAVFTRTSSP